jgi:beta-glucosidase
MVVNEEGERVFEGSKADIYVGFAGPDNRSAELTGTVAAHVSIEF